MDRERSRECQWMKLGEGCERNSKRARERRAAEKEAIEHMPTENEELHRRTKDLEQCFGVMSQ